MGLSRMRDNELPEGENDVNVMYYLFVTMFDHGSLLTHRGRVLVCDLQTFEVVTFISIYASIVQYLPALHTESS